MSFVLRLDVSDPKSPRSISPVLNP
eukprot:COSAG02_NODE_52292_length_308_cov_1.727273_1_plen_24_part_10